MLPPVASLDLEAKVGQLICPSLPRPPEIHDPATLPRLLAEQERFGWGGYILFFGDRRRTPPLLAALQTASAVPLLVAADLEHGAGQHLAGSSTFPAAMALGATGDPTLAEDLGAVTAAEALRTGVNWVLAPVADVNSNPDNPIINVRAFGGDPEQVGRFAAAFVRGCQTQGALACAKHFPGHGDTAEDSHSRLPTVPADRARLRDLELVPFRACQQAQVASVMTAHVAVPAVDPSGLPATLSPAVLQGVLREELGYDGLVVTDAFTMGGLTQVASQAEAAVRAIAAGCDVLLMPTDPAGVHAALVAAVRDGTLPEARVDEAVRRVFAAKARVRRGATEPLVPVPDAEELARTIAARSITLVRGPAGLVPVGDRRILHVVVDDGAEPEKIAHWRRLAEETGLGTTQVLCPGAEEAARSRLLAGAREVDLVLVALFSPIRIHKDRSHLPAATASLLEELAQAAPMVAVSFSSPYLGRQLPGARALVLTYGAHAASQDAVAKALTGERPMPGKLPIVLTDAPVDASKGEVPSAPLGSAWA